MRSMVDQSTDRPGFFRRLGPGLTAFLVIDVVLVLFLVLFAVQVFSGDDDGPEDAPVATDGTDPGQDETNPETEAPQEPTESETVEAFRLPSGNIFCEMGETAATCSILSYSYDPPAADGCDGERGAVLRIEAGGTTTFPCTGSGPSLPDGLPELDYGEASTVGEMTCQSSTNGVTCRHDGSGAGFSLARAGYTLFP
ncbi:hypothetical protein [Cellulomonas bogoriensis]|uniref:Uncharacterized protein n=1 Tax=Cellulomonas bogoriensis 69B4 = DSM 16987 TaxID=1386082 RepID=A0A0A0C332_9CELL|nr:hypothetical protein [Cellulomonas bogoriensis]KGM13724.1 hypothetical protein N869_15815 [Cellulomonas bogoriensis 69B4 = DSM 16987]